MLIGDGSLNLNSDLSHCKIHTSVAQLGTQGAQYMLPAKGLGLGAFYPIGVREVQMGTGCSHQLAN